MKMETKEQPAMGIESKELPAPYEPENTITVGGETIEIKPMKFKYERIGLAQFYHVIEAYTTGVILCAEKGVFHPEKDGDKCMMDWLVAVTDNPAFVRKHYGDFDSKIVDRLIEIHKRLCRVDEKAEHRKNLQTTGEGV